MASSLRVAAGRFSWLRAIPGVGGGTRLPWLPLSVMVVLVACSIFAPLLAPHDPTEISMLDSRLAPGEDPSYLLGTDIMGRGHAEPADLRGPYRHVHQPGGPGNGDAGGDPYWGW